MFNKGDKVAQERPTSFERFKKYKVEAESVEDFLDHYYKFNAETGMEAMTPAKFVEFVARIANQIAQQGEKSQQAAINAINAHFRN